MFHQQLVYVLMLDSGLGSGRDIHISGCPVPPHFIHIFYDNVHYISNLVISGIHLHF